MTRESRAAELDVTDIERVEKPGPPARYLEWWKRKVAEGTINEGR